MEIKKIEAYPSKKIIFDKKGFFVIYIQEDAIFTEHYSNISKGTPLDVDTGKLNMIITGIDSLTIGQTIIREGLVSRIDHSLYLGRELMKAEIALKNNLHYEQCKTLEISSKFK